MGSSNLKIRKVSSVEEKHIIIGMITSNEFMTAIEPIMDLVYFKNSYTHTIAQWCYDFYMEFGKVPNKYIKNIYESEELSIKEADAELIKKILLELSEQYDDTEINVEYLLKKAIRYFRSREIEIHISNIKVLSGQDNLDAAEEEINRFTSVSLELRSRNLVNFGDKEAREKVYEQIEKEDKTFFKLPGELGEYLGNMKRGDVVAYFAPAKRGKTNVLVDHFKHAILEGRKTVFFSIEMGKTEVYPRVDKTFFPMVDKEEGLYLFPQFDCIKNQTGECKDRESPVVILDGGLLLDNPKHVVCDKCKKSNDYEIRKKFIMTIYYSEIFRPQTSLETIRANFSQFENRLKKYARGSIHPKYTLTYKKMMNDLDYWARTENFIPDIIIIDYADILQFNSNHSDYQVEDDRWKLMAQIAGETNTLVLTATQANKEGHKAETLDSTHQGGFYGKNRHVNLMVGLNQTSDQKSKGIIEFGITEARSQEFIQGQCCTVLQDINAGQVYLDSYYPYTSFFTKK